MKNFIVIATILFASLSAQAITQCMKWSTNGFSETFRCPFEYSGVARWCDEMQFTNGRWWTMDRWQEEGCSKGEDNQASYCVRNCKSDR